MLQNEYLVAIGGFDRAESEPSKSWQILATFVPNTGYNLFSDLAGFQAPVPIAAQIEKLKDGREETRRTLAGAMPPATPEEVSP